MAASKTDGDKLRLGLFILRITTGMFFLAWTIDKFVASGHTLKVFNTFYFLSITPEISFAVGALQLAVVIAFMFGLWKKWTTGALLAMHTVSVLSTWQQLLFAYSVKGLLFWAAVPVWAGLLLLWLVRDSDTMCTLKLGK